VEQMLSCFDCLMNFLSFNGDDFLTTDFRYLIAYHSRGNTEETFRPGLASTSRIHTGNSRLFYFRQNDSGLTVLEQLTTSCKVGP